MLHTNTFAYLSISASGQARRCRAFVAGHLLSGSPKNRMMATMTGFQGIDVHPTFRLRPVRGVGSEERHTRIRRVLPKRESVPRTKRKRRRRARADSWSEGEQENPGGVQSGHRECLPQLHLFQLPRTSPVNGSDALSACPLCLLAR